MNDGEMLVRIESLEHALVQLAIRCEQLVGTDTVKEIIFAVMPPDDPALTPDQGQS